MDCFICKRDLSNAGIASVVGLRHSGETVYVHIAHNGVPEEYSRQNGGQKLIIDSPVTAANS
jgi:hypothetical protein